MAITRCRMPGWMLVVAGAPLVGCSSDLSRSEAAKQIKDHLAQNLPSYMTDSVRGPVEVRVRTILKPDESNRRVRFRTYRAIEDSSGVMQPDSSDMFEIDFQRSDEGWEISRYGQSLREALVVLASVEVMAEYDEVSGLHHDLWLAAINWDVGKLEERLQAKVNSRRWNELWRQYSLGIPEESLRVITAGQVEFPDNVTWGVFEPDYKGFSRTLWVRALDDTTLVCASLLGAVNNNPSEFYWIGEHSTISCRGGSLDYISFEQLSSEIAENIQSSGGVLTR